MRAKKGLGKLKQGLLHVGKRHVAVDVQTLNLVKHTVAARRDGLVAEHASGSDDANRRLARLHGAHLNIGRVGTQRPIWIAGQKEGVLHVPCGVLGRKIQRRKVVPVVLHFRALSHGESHAAKNVDEFVANLTHGVVRAREAAPTWTGDVFGVDTNLWFGIGKF